MRMVGLGTSKSLCHDITMHGHTWQSGAAGLQLIANIGTRLCMAIPVNLLICHAMTPQV